MFALWMISVNSLGFTCLNTNLKFFHKFQEFQSMAERLFDRKILAIQFDWGGVSKIQFFFFPQGWHIPSRVLSICTSTKCVR
jgi:hypothetical protein